MAKYSGGMTYDKVAELDQKLPYKFILLEQIQYTRNALYRRDIPTFLSMIEFLYVIVAVPYASPEFKDKLEILNTWYNKRKGEQKSRNKEYSPQETALDTEYGIKKLELLMELLKKRGVLGRESEYGEL